MSTKDNNRCWPGYEPVKNKEPPTQGSCRPKAESKLTDGGTKLPKKAETAALISGKIDVRHDRKIGILFAKCQDNSRNNRGRTKQCQRRKPHTLSGWQFDQVCCATHCGEV